MPFIVVAILLVLAGCQTTTQDLPPNEFTFNASKTATKEAIISQFVQKEYQIKSDSEFQLVMDRRLENNFAAQLVFGSRLNIVPAARVTLTFLGDKPTRVISNLAVVTNPGTGFESINSMNNNVDGRQAIQRAMEAARASLAAR